VPGVEGYTGGGASGGTGGLSVAGGRQAQVAGIDPRVRELVSAGAKHLPPGYKVQITSGYSPTHGSSGSQHRREGSSAMDVQIIGPDGKPISNRGDDPSGMYTRLARGAYGEMLATHPDLKGQFAWGGAFGVTGKDQTRDLMHFDVGGERGRFRQAWMSNMGELPGEQYGTDRMDKQIGGGTKAEGKVDVSIVSNGTAAKAQAKSSGDLFQATRVQSFRQMQPTDRPWGGPQ
jgi:hypothetical protein